MSVDDKHDCPAVNCSRQVPYEQFACRNHWFQLPKHLRDAIWSGYRSGDLMAHAQAMSDARAWYQERAT